MGGKTTKRARGLRKESSFPERLLWSKLRNSQLAGWKFRRQHPVGPYFADFACVEVKLIVELDGDTHGQAAQQEHDLKRTVFLESEGWEVMRIWNAHLMENIDGALDGIQDHLEHRKHLIEGAGSTPLPQAGEEGPAAEGGGR
jgi:very-short-patch-repair endonuclease